MLNIQGKLLSLMLVVAAFSYTVAGGANAATAEDLNKDAVQALETLYKTNPVAKDLSKRAKAVLVFPNIVKAGFDIWWQLR
jgi:lipid-binding SYLF domain-containing protein